MQGSNPDEPALITMQRSCDWWPQLYSSTVTHPFCLFNFKIIQITLLPT